MHVSVCIHKSMYKNLSVSVLLRKLSYPQYHTSVQFKHFVYFKLQSATIQCSEFHWTTLPLQSHTLALASDLERTFFLVMRTCILKLLYILFICNCFSYFLCLFSIRLYQYVSVSACFRTKSDLNRWYKVLYSFVCIRSGSLSPCVAHSVIRCSI
jgi:hypothetical protein